MADSAVSQSLNKVKAYLNSQVHDANNRGSNLKLLRAVGLFAGSVFLMQKYGDLMAV